MTIALLDLIGRLSDPRLQEADIITWGSPIISFGNLSRSKIATLGLNPSNREFVDVGGMELSGEHRRFHTLSSLGLRSWSDADEKHAILIAELCDEYFNRNPYDAWFKKLDFLISGTSMSYYFPSGEACHLDLIPFATSNKWAKLTSDQRNLLLKMSSDTLGLLLKNSEIKLLVLNGKTVVDHLKRISNVNLKETTMPNWTLPRKDSIGIVGYAYSGIITSIGGVKLTQELQVLGFNHNIQSSFGVTTLVQNAIRSWITIKSKEIFK